MKKINRIVLFSVIASLFSSLDFIIKDKIEEGMIDNGVIDRRGFAEIEKHHNKGLPLNKLDGHTKEITAISASVTAAHLMASAHDLNNSDDLVKDIANSLILAGAVSNTYDRINRGYVVDYLKLGKKKAIYNISDFCIIGGVILTIFSTLKSIKE